MVSIIVCGGRDYSRRSEVFRVLDMLHAQYGIKEVISGCARGADTLGESWASANGIPVEKYPALWDVHGRGAGPIRNQLMLDDGKPDGVVAFPGGSGTADMVGRAKAADVWVFEVPDMSEFW